MLPLHPNPTDLLQLLRRLAALPRGTEWVEFKVNNPSEIGEYISALANSAVLCDEPADYMVWGVENGTHRLVGTRFHKKDSHDSACFSMRKLTFSLSLTAPLFTQVSMH